MIKETVKQNAKLFLRFFVSLFLTILLTVLSCVTAGALSAAEPGSDEETHILAQNPDAEPIDTSVMEDVFGIDGSQTLEIILLVTILSVAPSFLVMVTSFTRIIIVFSFLRNAMQTQSIPPNSVLTGLALFLTFFVMWPTFTRINDEAYQPYTNGEISATELAERASVPLKEFMLKNTTKANMQFFLDLSNATVYRNDGSESATPAQTTAAPTGTPAITSAPISTVSTTAPADTAESADGTVTTVPPQTVPMATGVADNEPLMTDILGRDPVILTETDAELTDFIDQLGLETVIPAFIVSELTRAFQMGFLLFIPFLVIDIVVSSTLMAMGMMMLPPSMISMPFKIMLFVLVDGWQLLVGTVVNSFNL